VLRDDFRAACGLTSERFLIAANFFLFNVVRGGRNVIPVDEFVRHAVVGDHSAAFDRLGLFVLNLSLGGKRSKSGNGVEFPAPWANEFVKQALWQSGRWRRAALDEPAMDAFLASRITGVADAKQKCRSNYRHLYELTKYLPSASPAINTGAEAWIAAALFTAWDRRALAAGMVTPPPSSAALVRASEAAEDYKLLGLDVGEFRVLAPPIADQYASAGGLARFGGGIAPPAPTAPTTTPAGVAPTGAAKPSPSPAPAVDLGWLTVAGSEAAVEREISRRLEQKRDQVLATKLKSLYEHRCMACGEAVVIGFDPERHYAEAAHIKPLGKPHDGPDKPGNMLVLCANHHIQFDRGVLSIRRTPAGAAFVSRIPGDPTHGKAVALHPKHKLEPDCVEWHSTTFARVGE
jgi:hypothetical protein